MKIGILSDTHLSSLNDGYILAERLLAGPFQDVEMILHAGDHTVADFHLCFPDLPYFGVCGNMDRISEQLPQQRIVNVKNIRIGMTHGCGGYGDIKKHVLDTFQNDTVDVVIFGHSHQPCCENLGNVLLLNPGSATDKRSAPFHSVAVLTVAEEISAEIFSID